VLATKIGMKRTLVLGLLVQGAAGVMSGLSHSYLELAIFRIASGVGGSVFVAMTAASMAVWFHNKEVTFALGVTGGAAFSAGAALALCNVVFEVAITSRRRPDMLDRRCGQGRPSEIGMQDHAGRVDDGLKRRPERLGEPPVGGGGGHPPALDHSTVPSVPIAARAGGIGRASPVEAVEVTFEDITIVERLEIGNCLYRQKFRHLRPVSVSKSKLGRRV